MIAAMLTLALMTACGGDDPDLVTTTIRVVVPASTPRDARIFLAGSDPLVGRWKPDGLAMVRDDDGRFSARLELPRGQTLHYKITQGTWRTVERAGDGRDRDNRVLVVDQGGVVEIKVEAWADGRETPLAKSTATGDIRLHQELRSNHVANSRAIWVWLPPGYETSRSERFPVLYLHDGQNVFDAASAAFGHEWRADETAARLIQGRTIPPIIIIAIANTSNRMNEYTTHIDENRNQGGQGEIYAKFLVDEVKPFVDRTYRTRPDRMHTAIAGSSLGGLISLEIALRYPETFGKVAALSPSIWWSSEQIIKDVADHHEAAKQLRVWIDMGTQEGARPGTPSPEIPRLRRLGQAFRDAGLAGDRALHVEEIEGGQHREDDWASRFDRVLTFLFAEGDE